MKISNNFKKYREEFLKNISQNKIVKDYFTLFFYSTSEDQNLLNIPC